MHDYEHDIFISYRRTRVGKVWVPDYFIPGLEDELEQELGRDVNIFVDVGEIQTGDKWKKTIKKALARSKCILPVLCGLYFKSQWCATEYAMFYQKEKELNPEGSLDTCDLILPILVRDGKHLPDISLDPQHSDYHDYWMKSKAFVDSTLHIDFRKKIRKLAIDISGKIESAPDYNKDWESEEWFSKLELDKFYLLNNPPTESENIGNIEKPSMRWEK